MGKDIKEPAGAHELEPVSLSELIHQHVRAAIEAAVREELHAALGTSPYERSEVRRGYCNGMRELTLTEPTAPVVLAEIRGTTSTASPTRRMPTPPAPHTRPPSARGASGVRAS